MKNLQIAEIAGFSLKTNLSKLIEENTQQHPDFSGDKNSLPHSKLILRAHTLSPQGDRWRSERLGNRSKTHSLEQPPQRSGWKNSTTDARILSRGKLETVSCSGDENHKVASFEIP